MELSWHTACTGACTSMCPGLLAASLHTAAVSLHRPRHACTSIPHASSQLLTAPRPAPHHPAGDVFADPKAQGMMYAGLAASSAALGAVALLMPGMLLNEDVAQNVMEATFARVAGTTMILSAAVEVCLKGAAEAGRLGSMTYQRLQMASVLKAALFLGLFVASPQLWAPTTVLALPAIAAASLAVNMGVAKVSARHLSPRPQPPAPGPVLAWQCRLPGHMPLVPVHQLLPAPASVELLVVHEPAVHTDAQPHCLPPSPPP